LRDGHSRLVGVVPLLRYRDTLRGFPVRVLGSYNNDHASRTGMLAETGREMAVAQALAAHLARIRWQWDVILLRQLPGDAGWLPLLFSACEEAGLSPFAPTPGTGKCVLSLSGTWEEFLATKSRHFRTRLRENMRRVQKHGTVVYRRSSGSAEDFEIFANLEETSWKDEDDHARLGTAGWAFQHEVAMASSAGITCHNLFLELDGQVVGGVHALAHDGTVYSMQTLFDESQRHLYPGRAQFTMHVADMFEEARYEKLDLNGNSPFCKSWSEMEQPFVDLQIYGRQPYSRLLCSLKRMAGRNR
jgi:CelD/BcsL family acetyltransferase involved in cellulose biosynthesis